MGEAHTHEVIPTNLKTGESIQLCSKYGFLVLNQGNSLWPVGQNEQKEGNLSKEAQLLVAGPHPALLLPTLLVSLSARDLAPRYLSISHSNTPFLFIHTQTPPDTHSKTV